MEAEDPEGGLRQLERLNVVLQEQPDLRRLLENPTISTQKREKLLKEISNALGFSRRMTRFLEILTERNRLALFDEIVATYRRLLDERLGIVRAVVTAAQPMDTSLQSQLAARLEKVTGKRVRMEVSVDPSLIGGVVARVGGTVYDGSVLKQLQVFRNRLVQE
jgi:F-type H+-transporting ATPase subunit delta